MNIFVLDENPQIAARYHVDKHVVKMILESAQLLATGVRLMNGTRMLFGSTGGAKDQELYLLDGESYKRSYNAKGKLVYTYENQVTYKIAHKNHPCAIWARASLANWYWLRELAGFLNAEYRHRFNHGEDHKSYTVIKALPEPRIAELSPTPYVQAVAPECKRLDAVEAYRLYYNTCKTHLFQWTKRDKPFWVRA